MKTLHEALHMFLRAEVTGWRIPAWGIPSQPHDDGIAQTDKRQTYRLPKSHWLKITLTSLAPYTKVKNQILKKAPELLRFAHIS
jgi:hypothetical protein